MVLSSCAQAFIKHGYFGLQSIFEFLEKGGGLGMRAGSEGWQGILWPKMIFFNV